jgi:DNA repair protein RecN (Recombination protein N)
MLRNLLIKNFILIDELEIEFKQGLCVISGETGAGKSILLEAILFCFGKKFTFNIIKNGADIASVTSVFDLYDNNIKNLLDAIQIDYQDELVIKCVQTSNNRRKFLINDQIVMQKTLEQIGFYLFELHGQSHYTSLQQVSTHIDILDVYGNLLQLRESVYNSFLGWKKIEHEIADIAKEKDNISREIDYLRFVMTELSTAKVFIGEEEQLINKRRSLQNHDKELESIKELYILLSAPEIDHMFTKATRAIGRNSKKNECFNSISQNLDESYNSLERARDQLKIMNNDLSISEFDLETIEERLFYIKDLSRKYLVSCDELPNFLQTITDQSSVLEKKIDHNHQLQEQLLHNKLLYFDFARTLSHKRAHICLILEQKTQIELASLKMEKAIFKINMTSKSDQECSAKGIDDVCFTISTNPGTAPLPIDKIASGGELSRSMLALKVAISDCLTNHTIIFDEIDTGIGGSVADAVGERLKKLSQASQVIVITHQPQVACKADHHIFIYKTQFEDHTKIMLKILNYQERIEELARMISGKSITEISLKAGAELMNN